MTITSTLNARDEIVHLNEQRRLMEIERQELDREKQSFMFQRKKHETEIWAIKHDYNEQTKVLKKHHSIYKQRIKDLQHDAPNTIDEIKMSKLETKEQLLRTEQENVHKMQKSSQSLYQRCNRILDEIKSDAKQLEIWSTLCDKKCQEERLLLEQHEEDRQHHLEIM